MEQVTGHDIYMWCVDKGIDPQCIFGLGGDFKEINDDIVLKEVTKLYGIHRAQVADRWQGKVGDTIAVLIKNENSLDPILLPGMIVLTSIPDRRLTLLWPEVGHDGDEERDGPVTVQPVSGGDSRGFRSNRAPPRDQDANDPMAESNQAEAVVDKVVSHLERWHFEGGYRRLRIFSGISPVPAGEENYELWREAAIQHSEEWQCPEHIKRQRVVESLRGLAMGIIQATRRSNQQASLMDYIEALDYSYGTIKDVGDLLARLNSTYQEYGESLTRYIYRIDRLIYKIIDKGGIPREQADERRLKQVLKGALTNCSVAQKLRCTLYKAIPPTLNELVKEVKLEEVQIENRDKTVKKVKVISPVAEKPSQDERLLTLLEEQNKKLEQLIALQTNIQVREYIPATQSSLGRGNSRRGENRPPLICYACGYEGHRAFECPLNTSRFRGRGNGNYNNIRRPESLENSNGSPVTPSQAPQL
ncbi:paraneoplastic antigen Ma2-like [Pseudophryne corroboree]|uniref:paraneoplastic antigen Ma2-like n=1 Tax=Pseudophryne corroboree TaxID=495146 RepID=UPI0030821F63